MSWEGYWLPNLVNWLLGGAASVVVGFLVRRWLLQIVGEQQRTTEHAEQGALSASQASQAAQDTKASQTDVVRRLQAVEATVGGIKDAISASLAHRALEDLRWRGVERQLETLDVEGGGRHAAAGDDP